MSQTELKLVENNYNVLDNHTNNLVSNYGVPCFMSTRTKEITTTRTNLGM